MGNASCLGAAVEIRPFVCLVSNSREREDGVWWVV